jgi:hypothetical protein
VIAEPFVFSFVVIRENHDLKDNRVAQLFNATGKLQKEWYTTSSDSWLLHWHDTPGVRVEIAVLPASGGGNGQGSRTQEMVPFHHSRAFTAGYILYSYSVSFFYRPRSRSSSIQIKRLYFM